jgi:hypothetical protein
MPPSLSQTRSITRGPDQRSITRGPDQRSITRGPDQRSITRGPDQSPRPPLGAVLAAAHPESPCWWPSPSAWPLKSRRRCAQQTSRAHRQIWMLDMRGIFGEGGWWSGRSSASDSDYDAIHRAHRLSFPCRVRPVECTPCRFRVPSRHLAIPLRSARFPCVPLDSPGVMGRST